MRARRPSTGKKRQTRHNAPPTQTRPSRRLLQTYQTPVEVQLMSVGVPTVSLGYPLMSVEAQLMSVGGYPLSVRTNCGTPLEV